MNILTKPQDRVFYEVYEDTEKVKALDEYLARQGKSSGAGVS